jgi:hypothetical protein
MGADVAGVPLDVSYRDKTGHRLNAGTCRLMTLTSTGMRTDILL